MQLFKPKIVKEIYGGAWGHMVSVHKIDVDTLAREIRCVEKKGKLADGLPVTLLRLFKLSETKNLTITGWETFDQHPELIIWEGHLKANNTAFLEQKRDFKTDSAKGKDR
jgi:hypothetical protein